MPKVKITKTFISRVPIPKSNKVWYIDTVEFLEDIKYQRQQMGIIKSKAHGVHCGRSRKLSDIKLLKAIYLKEHGYTNLQVANKFHVSRSTLLRNLAEKRKAG